ncbi:MULTISPECIES: flagellar hook capping FlgD N-terminal domain-containing protein [unclassified Pusillimonas]|uniref:flagellar hook capping FlgD N-terminal domain-containing protein n=1 Tax=unclassified Pusillimonas TaxID=2640016 RepID=UPI000B9CD10B|nr:MULTISPECIES: flagellar hook capping FlgD N-terminal domain-containing protein [unclassified Pusillimonas]OXR49701.1 flagellar basal body rod modification protein [Pusillimonas sp. T2]ROT45103.1 flagellar basal body rod modification protein [Pusillimonas sp. NJUB218]
MATVNPTSNAVDSASMFAANAAANKRAEDAKNQFMTLLVTQLRNQDPLSPMDNAQFTSQLAQLETVNGITQLNNTLLALSGQLDMTQSMQAASLIGKGVLVTGNKISLGSSQVDGETVKVATPFGVDLISSAQKVVVTIQDGSGRAVRTIELGATPSGVLSMEWDGLDDAGQPVADGAYSVQVAATGAEGVAVSSEALTYGKVSSVAYASDGVRLDLGLVGSRSLFDIRKIM